MQADVDRERRQRRRRRRAENEQEGEGIQAKAPIESRQEDETKEESEDNDEEEIREVADQAWKEAKDAEMAAEEAVAKAKALKRKAHAEAQQAQKKLALHRATLEKQKGEPQCEGATSKASSLVGATPKAKPAPPLRKSEHQT